MAAPTLTLTVTNIRDTLTRELFGVEKTYSALDSYQKLNVDDCVNSGLRDFYLGAAAVGGNHLWSFMRVAYAITLQAPYSTGTVSITAGVATISGGSWPSWTASGVLNVSGVDYSVASVVGLDATLDNTTVTAAAGTSFRLHQDDYDLPENFGEWASPLTWVNNNWGRSRITIIPEHLIRTYRQGSQLFITDGLPRYVAIAARKADADAGRLYAMFFPSVARSEMLEFRYRVAPNVLHESTNPYPYGAVAHSETIMQAVRAAAEIRLTGARGPHFERYIDLIQRSIQVDKLSDRPETFTDQLLTRKHGTASYRILHNGYSIIDE